MYLNSGDRTKSGRLPKPENWGFFFCSRIDPAETKDPGWELSPSTDRLLSGIVFRPFPHTDITNPMGGKKLFYQTRVYKCGIERM